MPDEPINRPEPDFSEDDLQREELGPRGVPGKESPTKMTPQVRRRRRKTLIPDTQHSCLKPTQEPLDQLKRLSQVARVPDESEIVTTKEEAETRIRDLKEKARME